MSLSNQHSFSHWHFSPVQNLLVNTDDNTEHVLEAKQAELLAFLIIHQQQIVSREQLVEQVWHNRYVDDKTVNSTISRIRKILGGDKNEYIKTHPKRGYSFVAPLNQATPHEESEASSPKSRKSLFIGLISICCIILVIWFGLKTLQQQGVTQTLANDKPTPLTDYIGWEMFPQIGSHNLLAYIHFDLESRIPHTKVQTIQEGSIREVLSIKDAIFPTWSQDGSLLYYQQWNGEQCSVEYRQLDSDFNFAEPQQLTTCSLPEKSMFSIDDKQRWIYFDALAEDGKSRVIKRRDITTNHVENLTRSGATYNQDRNVSLSPNGQYLVFIRQYNKRDNQLMLMDLYNGQVTSLAKIRKAHYISRPNWHTDNETVFYVSDNKVISSINIHSKKQSIRFQASETISHVAISPSNQLVFMQGKQIVSNAVQVNLAKEPLKVEYIARSTFENYAAATFKSQEISKSAFVSFRSETEQIWLKEGTHYTQLTDFTDGGTTYMQFSNSGEQLLFIRQQKLYFLDIQTKKVTPAELPWSDFKYPYWQCGSNTQIVLSALDKGQWNLYRYDVTKNQAEKMTDNIASYHHSCEQNRRFVTLAGQQGIFELDNKGQIMTENHYFKETPIRHWRNWDAYDNKLYVMTSYSTFKELDLTTLTTTEREFADLSTWAINVEFGYMVLNKTTEQDTHLASVSIH